MAGCRAAMAARNAPPLLKSLIRSANRLISHLPRTRRHGCGRDACHSFSASVMAVLIISASSCGRLPARDRNRSSGTSPRGARCVPDRTVNHGASRALLVPSPDFLTWTVAVQSAEIRSLPSWSCRFDPGRPLHIRPDQRLNNHQAPELEQPPCHTSCHGGPFWPCLGAAVAPSGNVLV